MQLLPRLGVPHLARAVVAASDEAASRQDTHDMTYRVCVCVLPRARLVERHVGEGKDVRTQDLEQVVGLALRLCQLLLQPCSNTHTHPHKRRGGGGGGGG